MCGEAADDSLAALKIIPDWFITSKMIKKLYSAFRADDGLLFLMKVLVMSRFVVMKWVFLVKILMIISVILMKMILILLFLSNFWLAIESLKKSKLLKKR